MNCRPLKSDPRCGQIVNVADKVYRSSSVLSHVTKEIEFMAFAFSVTQPGYEMRVKQRVGIIQAFPQHATWNAAEDDYEIAQELLDILAQHRN